MSAPGDEAQAARDTQRLDKWLWFARLAKSRTLAAELVVAGKIRVNRVKAAKSSHLIRVGDVITSAARQEVRIVRVRALGARRGPAPEAAALYEELTPGRSAPDPAQPSPTPMGAQGSEVPPPPGARTKGAGRPTKRERRLTDRLKEWSG